MNKHILIGDNLILNINHIVSANLSDFKNGKNCISINLQGGTVWTVWANLQQSREVLKSTVKINENLELIENIEKCVLSKRVGRESNLSKELKEILKL